MYLLGTQAGGNIPKNKQHCVFAGYPKLAETYRKTNSIVYLLGTQTGGNIPKNKRHYVFAGYPQLALSIDAALRRRKCVVMTLHRR